MTAPPRSIAAAALILSLGAGYWSGSGSVLGSKTPLAVASRSRAEVPPGFPLDKLERAATADMPGIWMEMWRERMAESNGSPQARPAGEGDALRALLFRWAELDPAAVLAFFGEPGQSVAETQLACQAEILAAWAERDARAALAGLDTLPDLGKGSGRDRESRLNSVGWHLQERNPAALWDWFQLCHHPVPSGSWNPAADGCLKTFWTLR